MTTPRTASGPTLRVVLGSLLTGRRRGRVHAGGIARRPRARDHRSALLAFATGWAMLAVLYQSTSAVGIRAAAVMAVTGVGLLTVAPGNSILTGAGALVCDRLRR